MTETHNIFDLFEIQATQTPDAVAVIEADGIHTTYRELLDYACLVSNFLHASGITAEQPIGILLSRTAKMVGVLLGIMRSGAAYVPINTEHPQNRQRRYVEQAGIVMMITDAAFEDRAELLNNTVERFVIANLEALESRTYDSVQPVVENTNLAYILFTSGTTGEPKGVEIEHRNVSAVVQATAQMLSIYEEDCFLAASPLSFDLSVLELFVPLIHGARILLRDKTCWGDLRVLSADIKKYGVTIVQTSPSLWSIVLGKETSFPHVRIAATGGEAIQEPLAEQLIEVCDEAWNFYGPTEGTVLCTAYKITKEGLKQDVHSPGSLSIGRPLECAQVQVVDGDGKKLPPGKHGELCMTGAGLSRGYRNDAVLTSQKFIYPEGESVRYYRTGDLVSQDIDGNLRYYGRIDDQLQIHGLRIEPGDIESELRKNIAVKDVAVTWYETKAGSKQIMAAVVRADATLTAFDLHEWLSERLPFGMLPSHFTFTEHIPLLTSGKIDRRAIRNLLPARTNAPDTELRRLTTTEEFVMDAWRNVLKLDFIHPTDHFFTIGGDSLSAVILATRIEASTNIQLPDEFVYKHDTIEKMALRLDVMRIQPVKPKNVDREYSLPAKIYGKLKYRVKRHFLRKTTRKARTLAEILELQKLYIDVWQGQRAPGSLIVTLNAGGNKRPMYWCMQAYWELAELAKVMPDHPIHGMRSGARVLDIHSEPEMQKLASQYAHEIQNMQPAGPLVIGGNCNGAKIMHHVAEFLMKLGREIEVLILLEHRSIRPYSGRVHLIYGDESRANPYLENGAETDHDFKRLYPNGYAVDIVPGKYAELFRPQSIQRVAEILQKTLVKTDVSTADMRLSN